MDTINLATNAYTRRRELSQACKAWQARHTALEAVLLATRVIRPLEFVDKVWSDSPETVMVRVNGSTLIEIDVESGNHARGTAAE